MWKDFPPKISIVTPSLNQGKYIRDNIDSVLRQEYAATEHIVIDGGSTDETLSILKTYSHLIWVSEPDDGQADALEKGFRMATGEIIAWLNADDWYEPKIFSDVVNALAQYPVVMGVCELRDKNNQRMYQVDNIERDWFDMLKYWTPYSIPCQPSIFMKRSILAEVLRPNGTIFDKELNYVMDYDLWMRIARNYSFTKRISKVLSYYRMTEENKTSHEIDGMPYAEPEMSRVFHRSIAARDTYERSFSFAIPLTNLSDQLKQTITSLLLQTVPDYEILLLDHSGHQEVARALKIFASQINQEQRAQARDCYLRCIQVSGNALQALNTAIQHAKGKAFIALTPGSIAGSDTCLAVSEALSSDMVPLALPLGTNYEAYSQLVNRDDLNALKIGAVFSCSPLPWCFAARKIALLELAGIRTPELSPLAMRELLLRLWYKGWKISGTNRINIKAPSASEQEREISAVLTNYMNAKIISEIQQDFENEPFAKVRAAFNPALTFSGEMVSQCRSLLACAPAEWQTLNFKATVESLKETCAKYPKFSPGFYFLNRELERVGDAKAAGEAKKRFEELRCLEGM